MAENKSGVHSSIVGRNSIDANWRNSEFMSGVKLKMFDIHEDVTRNNID